MAEEFSPEEKLLRLIRGEKKQKDRSVPERTASPQRPGEAPATGTKTTKDEPRGNQAVIDEWKYLKFINVALIIILIVTISFFIFDFISSNLRQPVLISGQGPKGPNYEPSPTAETKGANREAQTMPFSAYSESIGRRELFKPQQSEVRTERTSGAKIESASDKLKDLSLIGIIAGEKPQAVIEDKKIQKTYFLYKGQILNQMKLEEILEDRVILDFEGEKFELTL